MAPLRSDLLSGDLRLFYLLWLTAVEDGDLEDDEKEPLPGIGPSPVRSKRSPISSISIRTWCKSPPRSP